MPEDLLDVATFAAAIDDRSLPADLLRLGSILVRDSLGCALHGSTTRWGKQVLTLASGEGTGNVLWGSSGADTGLYPALLAHGTLIHAFDWDDQCLDGGLHAGSAVVPVALALGVRESAGWPQILAAIVLGAEAGVRLGERIGDRFGRIGLHVHGWTGAVAASVTAARMLGLDEERTRQSVAHAIGLGGGLMAAQRGDTKRLHAGRAAQAGVVSAFAARDGRIADLGQAAFEPGGLMRTLMPDIELGGSLESGFALPRLMALKPIPAKMQVQAAYAALSQILDEVSPPVDQIDSIDVSAGDYVTRSAGRRYSPAGPMAAQASIAYTLAWRALVGRVGPDAYSETATTDPSIAAWSKRVRVTAVEDSAVGRWGSRVTVRTSDGQTFAHQVESAPGFPERPLGPVERADKFRRQAAFALQKDEVARLDGCLARLEADLETEGPTELVSMLVGREKP